MEGQTVLTDVEIASAISFGNLPISLDVTGTTDHTGYIATLPKYPELFHLMCAALYKIESNNSKRSGWQGTFNENGDRDWRNCDIDLLKVKLMEEVGELFVEVTHFTTAVDSLKEGADVVALVMMVLTRLGVFEKVTIPDGAIGSHYLKPVRIYKANLGSMELKVGQGVVIRKIDMEKEYTTEEKIPMKVIYEDETSFVLMPR